MNQERMMIAEARRNAAHLPETASEVDVDFTIMLLRHRGVSSPDAWRALTGHARGAVSWAEVRGYMLAWADAHRNQQRELPKAA